jgi:uncharacterized integral membrane protein
VRLRESERGLYTLIAITALLVIYVVAFVVSNSGRVEVSFVLFSGRAPLILVMVLCVGVGLLLGMVAGRLGTRLRESRTTTTTPLGGGEPPADLPE